MAKESATKPRTIKVVEGDGEIKAVDNGGTREVKDLKPHPYAQKVPAPRLSTKSTSWPPT